MRQAAARSWALFLEACSSLRVGGVKTDRTATRSKAGARTRLEQEQEQEQSKSKSKSIEQ